MQLYLIVLLPFGGLLVGWLGHLSYAGLRRFWAKQQAQDLLAQARIEGERERLVMLEEGRELLQKERQLLEKDLRGRSDDVRKNENRLSKRENFLNERTIHLDKREQQVARRNEGLKKREDELEQKLGAVQSRLEEIAQMSCSQAREELRRTLIQDAHNDAHAAVAKIEKDARTLAKQRACDIILTSIQRLAHTQVAESTVVSVLLPNDEMKGRIIGREGRNIRALETLTGADIIIDDTPDSVSVSCFDPVRKAIARMALTRLVADGRIHPAKIEETIEKVSEEVEKTMIEEAEKVLHDLEVYNLHAKGVRALGRLYYRSSYGQNVLYHSREVAMIAGMLAAELGLDAKICKRAALLHDLGKGLPPVPGADHAHAGAELARAMGEDDRVIQAIVDHHEDADTSTPELMVVKIADAISAARPGARRESIENYIKRLSELERIAQSFDGVERVFAFQAGRELRVMVNNQSVDDRQARRLAKKIAQQIEGEMKNFPGRIRITIIREMRAVEYAY